MSFQLDTASIVGIGQVVITGGLIYATWRLKVATDVMSSNQILPHITRGSVAYNSGNLNFSIKNTGQGTAYSIKITGTTPENQPFTVGMSRQNEAPDLAVADPEKWYIIYGVTDNWRNLKFTCSYEDARGRKYSQDLDLKAQR